MIVCANHLWPDGLEDPALEALLAAALDRAWPREGRRPGDWNDVLRRASRDGELQKILEPRSRRPGSSLKVNSNAPTPVSLPPRQEVMVSDVGWGTRAINQADPSQSKRHELEGWGTRPL